EPCICGSAKFFDKCDECASLLDRGEMGGGTGDNGEWITAWCYYKEMGKEQDTYYSLNKEKCTTSDGRKLGYYSPCTNKIDCFGNPTPCGGDVTTCENDEGADGEVACECGGRKWFKKCKEPCRHKWDGTLPTIYAHIVEDSREFTRDGNYPVEEVCTRLDGRKVYTTYGCNKTTPDQLGNMPPCAGLEPCPSGTWGSGDGCSCGGKLYFNSCVAECTFEDTAETCAAKGQSFEQKCYGSKNGQQTWFGQCK
ncbi:MAG: hypothetical protein Q4F75_00790, partial [Pseudomonadota bacterium]|nr:hypothetical protein [Pseudomonadota bacterium]